MIIECVDTNSKLLSAPIRNRVLRVFALDCSGSTGGSSNYFTLASKYLKEFAEDKSSSESIFLLWDDKCILSTMDEIESICKEKVGYGGTQPSRIVSWLISNYPAVEVELWLITDGQIGTIELNRCASLNPNVSYSKIKFIVIDSGTGSVCGYNNRADLSVGATFFSGSQVELFWNEKLVKEINTSKPFDYDKVNVDNFDDYWDDLRDFIKFKFMGSDRHSLEEVKQLTKLKMRLLEDFSNRRTSANSNKEHKKKSINFSKIKLKSAILAKMKEMEFYEALTNSGKKDFRQNLDAKISTLINYIHNKENRNYGFESLKVEFKCEQTKTVNKEPEPDLDSLKDVPPCKFFDAVSLEDEGTPVLLLNKTDFIQSYWIDQSFSKFKAILDCPLFAKIESSIGHVYSVETFLSLCKEYSSSQDDYLSDDDHDDDDFLLEDPLSREKVYGALIFCAVADRWNDYILSKTFFRGKRFRTCLPLWYFLIYKSASQKEWIEAEVVETLKAYAVRRMNAAKVPLALGTLPLDPAEIVPLHVALYYCTEGSSKLFGEHPTLFPQERLRMYHSVAGVMLEIVSLIGGIEDGIDEAYVMQRSRVLGLVSQLKRIRQKTEKAICILKKAFHVTSHGILTNKIKDKSYLRYLNLLRYSHKKVIPLNVLDRSLVDFRHYVVLPYKFEINKKVTISRRTCRPRFVLYDKRGQPLSYYRELTEYVKKAQATADGKVEIDSAPVKRLEQNLVVSHCKLYIDVTAKLKKFPTWEEYVEYARKRYLMLGDKIFLHFPDVEDHLQHFFQLYSSLNVDLEDFLAKSDSSIGTVKRVQMEGTFNAKNCGGFVLEERKVLL